MKVYASLFEHINDGFVWLKRPGLPARCVVKITNTQTKDYVFCEALQIDENFLIRYNSDRRISIEQPESSVVMNGWYRKRLGNLETNHDYPLHIKSADSLWCKVQASMHHPQNVVRIAIWLGIISCGLGLLSIIFGLRGPIPTIHLCW
jgi:hypothetical protein